MNRNRHDDWTIGEWLHGELAGRFGLETERWATEKVVRVERQLQVKRAPRDRKQPVVLWMQEMNAFTTPGRYMYISRELLQRASSDDPVALVMAHEMAHHDLGHLDLFSGRLAALRTIPGGVGIAAGIWLAHRILVSPEQESEADAYAFDLCRRAGFDGHRCLELFDILEVQALDHGDIDVVFGQEERPVDAGRALSGLRSWTWRHLRGYPSIRDRKSALMERIPQ